MENFTSLGLPEPLMKSLAQMKFDTPTPIQAQAIPPALEGRDILGSAQTGTGKTGAFGIPLVTKLMTSPRGAALVMTPTRELAVQVLKMLQQLIGNQTAIKTALLIGGEPMPKQLQQIRQRPRIIVGTPGRINDHLERGSLMLHDAGFLVLDETDRMLDMGFTIQIDKIMKFLPQQRQTLLFSATLPKNIVRISNQYLTDPVRVSVGSTTTPAANIKQEVLHISDADKYPQLLDQLDERNGSVIVFVKTKWGAEKMAIRLRNDHQSAEAIHGDLRQNKRDRVIAAFRNKRHRILVATDIAARGLDIPHIEHVINYDLPQCPEDYIHRIGRTARAGAEGSALCFISPADKIKWRAIQQLLDPNAAPEKGGYEGGQRSNRPRRSSGGKLGAKAGGRPFRGGNKGEAGGGSQGGERKSFGDDRKSHGKPSGDRPFRAKNPERADGERKQFGDRPEGKPFVKPQGKPNGQRTKFGGASASNGKPNGNGKPAGKPQHGQSKGQFEGPARRPGSRPENRAAARPGARPGNRPGASGARRHAS